MDSFSEPYTRLENNISLSAVRDQIRTLEEVNKKNGVVLSGRVIHVVHYLPVTCQLAKSTQIPPSPPLTPPLESKSVDAVEEETKKVEEAPTPRTNPWTISPRYGHAAMISGIQSLSETHEQVIVGWTGDISSSTSSSPSPLDSTTTPLSLTSSSSNESQEKVPSDKISEEQKELLEVALGEYVKSGGHEEEKGATGGEKKETSYVPVWLDDKVGHGHYDGYCKQILWPLFHYLLWQDVATEYASSADSNYPHYELANAAFASKIAEIYREGDLIWVHDYHLLLVPRLLRELLPPDLPSSPSIGLFVHTPFPSSEVFRCLPRRREILDGMLGATMVCFQTYSYARHFVSSCVRVCGYESLGGGKGKNDPNATEKDREAGYAGIDVEGRMVQVMHCPVGVDAERVGRDVLRPGIQPKLEALRTLYEGKKIIVGRDKLDVVKGVLQKVRPSFFAVVLVVNSCPPFLYLLTLPSTSASLSSSPLSAPPSLLSPGSLVDIVSHPLVDCQPLRLSTRRSLQLRAFEKLLSEYPEWIGNVVMIQVTSPALTDSPKLERVVSELVAHINGEYGSLDFVPVHHYHQTLKKDEFYALLGVADLAVITPLRDGMNTTSMEFVIAQHAKVEAERVYGEGANGYRGGGPSPLVLSEFMGISKHMEDALLVNPWNLGDVAAAINKGLLMSPSEKLRRQEKLYKVVTTHTSHTWAAVLVKMLLGSLGGQNEAKITPYLPTKEMKEGYERAGKSGEKGKRLFLFDYDGTLSPIVKTPSMAIPSPSTLLALRLLSSDPQNLVYIISGRDGAFLEQHLGHLDGIGFSAEHGGFWKERGKREWENFTESLDMSWMRDVEEVFRYYTERTAGSHVEVKKSSVVWHWRESDPEWGQFQCRQCHDLLETNLVNKRPIEVVVGKKVLEVRPVAVNKGEIVKKILYQNPDVEFIFCAGDDKTDEDMFRALQLFPTGVEEAVIDAPLGVTLNSRTPSSTGANSVRSTPGTQTPVEEKEWPRVKLAIRPDAIFTTAVGHSTKRTLAKWHVTAVQEVVDNMLELVGAREEAEAQVAGTEGESKL